MSPTGVTVPVVPPFIQTSALNTKFDTSIIKGAFDLLVLAES